MKKLRHLLVWAVVLGASFSLPASAQLSLPSSLTGSWTYAGRGAATPGTDSVTISDGFIIEAKQWTDCDFRLSALAPQDTAEVQIWAAIRVKDRDNRYVFGLRGGNNNDVYLARYSPDGQDKFLGLAPLGFKPVPGMWYKLRAQVSGKHFAIYVNDESTPRISVADDQPLWTSGGVALGGGWLPVEFREVKITDGAGSTMPPVAATPVNPDDKEALRKQQRAAYQGVTVPTIDPARTEVKLDGGWLFYPDQDLPAGTNPAGEKFDDSGWHVLDVPALWTPSLSWLYGENGWNNLPGVASMKGVCDNFYEAEMDRLNHYTFDWKNTRSGWYREYVTLPADISGRHAELQFDAIAKISQIYVNGTQVGSHTGMFGEIDCDASSALHPGLNAIAVHVIGNPEKAAGGNKVVGVAVTVEVTAEMTNSLPHGMFRSEASGIWQPVRLVVTQPLAISDIYIKPRLDGASFDVTVRNAAAQPAEAQLTYVIKSAKDGAVLDQSSSPVTCAAPAAGNTMASLSTPTLAPKLWSPADPNLYRVEVTLSSAGKILDRTTETFGFRTFTVEKNRLMLNGKPYWLRGADHFPSALKPNDATLAKRFMQLAHDGNVRMTRSHTVPFTETWLEAADETGMGVSFEGIWPWLMIKGPPPSDDLLKVWKDETSALVHKYRNHPSILIWTVNNEMKFPGFDKNDPEMLQKKWPVLSDMIKTMRQIDPTRPIVADSSYTRQGVAAEYDSLIKPQGFDDGDIDDLHAYFGWYEPSFFHFFAGQLGKHAWPDRPLISQEMSTGYSRNDDGHPVRSYLFNHQTPQALVGNEAYENRDPSYFLTRQAFMTKELAETFRRADRADCSGILHFAYLTWFKDVWNPDTIAPFPAYDGLKTALQPVLVSAELFGRHFYAGQTVTRRVCIVNDADDGTDLGATALGWQIVSGGSVLAQGEAPVPATPYYSNTWVNADFKLPAQLPSPRVDAQLVLSLRDGTRVVSTNRYDIVVATSDWAGDGLAAVASKIKVLAAGAAPMPAVQDLNWSSLASIGDLSTSAPAVVVVPDAQTALADSATAAALKQYAQGGGHVLLLNAGAQLAQAFPTEVAAYREATRTKEPAGEIVTMHRPESLVFDGLEPLDLAWFESGANQIPIACRGTYTLNRDQPDVIDLADECDLHGYLKKPDDMKAVSGAALIELDLGKGKIVASEMAFEAGPQDPIARRLLRNVVMALAK